jgi:hypothetical protein
MVLFIINFGNELLWFVNILSLLLLLQKKTYRFSCKINHTTGTSWSLRVSHMNDEAPRLPVVEINKKNRQFL